MKLTQDQVKKIAELAKIKLTDTELEKFTKEISSILEYAHQLNEVDVSDVDFVSSLDDFEGEVMREDQVSSAMSIEDVHLNSKDGRKKGDYFKTSKIL